VSVLVVAEHLRGQVRPITLELVSAAKELGEETSVAVIAKDPAAVADQVDIEGVKEIISVKVEQEEFENDVYCQAVEQLISDRSPDVVLVGFTVNGMGYAPALAAKLGIGFASDVFALRRDGDDLVAERSFYGSKVNAEVDFPGHDRVLLMIRPTAWPPAEGAGGAVEAELEASASISGSRARHVDFQEVAASGDVDITAADFLLSVGRGVGEKENVGQFEGLAEKMGATLSVSRPLVDQGWMPNSRQVGQSGKTVKPKVYLALGISGAVQHLAGMKTSGTIIAVNTDPEAAIFNVAHYGAVADLFEIAEELDKLYA
jgi:electron transfer flavoprotein alpha subunit